MNLLNLQFSIFDCPYYSNQYPSVIMELGSASNPYLISISERAEMVSLLFKERQKDTEETLEELKKIIKEINEANREQVEKKMPKEIFTIYWILKDENIQQAEDIAMKTQEIFEKHPFWKTSGQQERSLKNELNKILIIVILATFDTHKFFHPVP